VAKPLGFLDGECQPRMDLPVAQPLVLDVERHAEKRAAGRRPDAVSEVAVRSFEYGYRPIKIRWPDIRPSTNPSDITFEDG
jgi:hypothetical protein